MPVAQISAATNLLSSAAMDDPVIRDPARFPRTVAVFEQGRGEGLHLGAQVFASVAGTPVLDLALGEARTGQPMTRDALLIWLSSTKPVAAAALGQLWQRGLLELDDPIARHIPEFAERGKEGITLRHALTHTGGFRMLNVGWPEESWEGILRRICQARPEPRWVPGRRAGYHLESSWFVLGEVVRRVDGRPFERYVRDEIFEPLGMDDCWIGMPVERYRAYGERIAPMLNTDPTVLAEDASGRPRTHLWTREDRLTRCHPGGNGCGPMHQLARFYELLLQRGAGLLSAQTVEALTCPHRVGMYDHTFKHVMDWGLGFIINSEHYGIPTVPYGYGGHASPRTFGHSGRLSSTAFGDPEHGLAVALAFNGTPDDDRHRARMRAVTEAIYEDLGLVAASS